jgi:hypothetical protein
MQRFVLALVLLAAAAAAQAITPSRQDANGAGGTCPESETAAVTDTGAPAGPAPAASKTAPPQGKGGTSARPRSGTRWHSFLPGMFK